MSTFVNQPTPSVRPNGPQRKPAREPGGAAYEALKAQYEALLAKQQARMNRALTVHIYDVKSDGTPGKGGVGVSGFNARHPVVLYAEQWERMFEGVTAPEGTLVWSILQACKDPRASRRNG